MGLSRPFYLTGCNVHSHARARCCIHRGCIFGVRSQFSMDPLFSSAAQPCFGFRLPIRPYCLPCAAAWCECHSTGSISCDARGSLIAAAHGRSLVDGSQGFSVDAGGYSVLARKKKNMAKNVDLHLFPQVALTLCKSPKCGKGLRNAPFPSIS